MDEELITFGHGNVEEAEPEVNEEEKEEKEETAEAEETEATQDEKTNVEEEKEEPAPKKDSKIQALDYERARRKQAEKELKELKAEKEKAQKEKEEADTISKEREALKAKMLEGELIDEDIANKLLDTLGEDIIKAKLTNKRLAEEETFEKEFAELKKDDMFMDADKYKDKIREFHKKGLSLEEAYGASIPASRYAQLRKDLEVEIEQKILNNNKKAEEVDVGHVEAKDEEKRTSYTKKEQAIARETGLDVKEVRKRANMHTLDEFLGL